MSSPNADSKAKELNINAKPFVPSFGQQPSGGNGTLPPPPGPPPQGAKQSPQHQHQLPPPPPPPMPFAPPYGAGMMGMPFGMMNTFPGGAPPPRFFPPAFNGNGYPAPPPPGLMGGPPPPPFTGGQFPPPLQQQAFVNHSNNGHNGKVAPPYGQQGAKGVAVNVGGLPTPPLGPTRAPPVVGNGSFHGNNSFHNQQQHLPQAPSPQAPRKPVTFPRKVVFLVLGGRGSGKSTQCERLAKHYNLLHIAGGQFVADKKLPLVELDRVLGERFEKGVELGKAKLVEGAEEINGLVLDRMIGLHEYDAYYLDHILRRYGMAVELVFLLMLDSETAGQRALARGDSKPVEHTRQMAEHRIQYAAVNTVFSPLKILHCVECDGMPLEAITRALDRVIETHYANGGGASLPPIPSVPHHPYTQGLCKVVTDFEKFYALRQNMLVAVHNIPKPPVICPASLMSGLADRRMFVNPKQARPLVNSYVTLKADGQRVLLFKTQNEIYGINGVFHFMFHFTPYFESFGISMPSAPEGYSPEHGVEWVLDAEVFAVEGRPQVAVFDYLMLHGTHGHMIPFERRLEELKKFFSQVTIKENPVGTAAINGPSPLFLKQYVLSGSIRQLLPEPGKPPFPIDGIVFQHFGAYKFGKDNAIYKWKPRDHCSVDFRLDKSVDPQVAGAEWTFVPMVGDDKEEVQWPNAQVRASDADARRCDLCDGAIVECVKREGNGLHGHSKDTTKDSSTPPLTIWDFVRVRPEKSTPNRYEIAKAIDSIEHMTFEELAKSLEALSGKK